jgi:hypothetical protein
MRSHLHNFCVTNSYNMVSSYETESPCQRIPYSCNNGSKLYFHYGHDRAQFFSKSSTSSSTKKSLKIVMLREPLSWLTSRLQHNMRGKGGSPMSLQEAMTLFGMEYFGFFDDSIGDLIQKRFHQIVNSSSTSPSSSFPSPSSSYSQTLDRIDSYFQKEVFILQYSYYSKSMNSLSKIFSNTFVPSSSSALHLNPAYGAQQGHSMGTLAEVKLFNTLLELHNQVYYLSLREFYRQSEQL